MQCGPMEEQNQSYYLDRLSDSFGALGRICFKKFRQVQDRYFDAKYNIETTGFISAKQLKLPSEDSTGYGASPYKDILGALRRIEINPASDEFLDFGSGMGRTLVVAATFPFQKVTGIELSAKLNSIARINISKTRAKLVCPVEIIEGDVGEISIPTTATVFFFYNPFKRMLLKRVLDNIRFSLTLAPRKITVIFKNPSHFEAYVRSSPWMTKKDEFWAPFQHKIVIFESVPQSISTPYADF